MAYFDPFWGLSARRPSAMPMDAWRDGSTYVVELDLPGIAPDSLEVNVEHDVLTVRAERPEPGETRDWLLAERPTGVFTRQLSLSNNLDTEGITADYTDGVLRLRIPVAEAAKPRKIAVVPAAQHAISA